MSDSQKTCDPASIILQLRKGGSPPAGIAQPDAGETRPQDVAGGCHSEAQEPRTVSAFLFAASALVFRATRPRDSRVQYLRAVAFSGTLGSRFAGTCVGRDCSTSRN